MIAVPKALTETAAWSVAIMAVLALVTFLYGRYSSSPVAAWIKTGRHEAKKDELVALLEEIRYELRPNGGHSFRDQINARFDNVETLRIKNQSEHAEFRETVDRRFNEVDDQIAQGRADHDELERKFDEEIARNRTYRGDTE